MDWVNVTTVGFSMLMPKTDLIYAFIVVDNAGNYATFGIDTEAQVSLPVQTSSSTSSTGAGAGGSSRTSPSKSISTSSTISSSNSNQAASTSEGTTPTSGSSSNTILSPFPMFTVLAFSLLFVL